MRVSRRSSPLSFSARFSFCLQCGHPLSQSGQTELIVVEGVFDDQWMGREAVFSLRGQALVSLEIAGALAALGQIVPQRLRVKIDGRESVDVSLIAPGPF